MARLANMLDILYTIVAKFPRTNCPGVGKMAKI